MNKETKHMKKTILSSLLILTMLSTGCKKDEIIEPAKTKTSTVSTGSSTSGCTSVQCYATAKSTGSRCKNKTTNCNGRCYTHQ